MQPVEPPINPAINAVPPLPPGVESMPFAPASSISTPPSNGPAPAFTFSDLKAAVAPMLAKSPLQLVSDLYTLIPRMGKATARSSLGIHEGDKKGFVIAAEVTLLGWIITAGLGVVRGRFWGR